jgi:hypothetical protein
MAKFMDMFDQDDKCKADCVWDYYDGESKEHLMKFLQTHRKNALKKGLIPRARNIVKMIADKSGLLFNGKAPTINVYSTKQSTSPDDVAGQVVLDVLDSADWVEFFTNFDVGLRMLKSAMVLVQYSPERNQWVLEMLDQHNSAVAIDDFKQMTTLIYETGETEQGDTYRIWTPELVQDLLVDESGNETLSNPQPNPYGIIPAAMFHDTNIPRDDAWNEIPMDLIEINDIYNLHLTDSEYASAWNKQPTLFTNAIIQGGTGQQMTVEQFPDEKLPRWVPSSDPGFVGGPGTVVAVETNGDTVYLDYKKPDVNLMPLDQMVNKWVADFAGDWSVNIKLDGQGSKADSGFKLIVEELQNLELRKSRQRMMEAGFKRLYEVIKIIAIFNGISLPAESTLYVKFAPPDLPIDEKATEEVWSRRIQERRASRVDYFMEVKGMSRAEAEAKIIEIDAEAPATPNRSPTTGTVATVVKV